MADSLVVYTEDEPKAKEDVTGAASLSNDGVWDGDGAELWLPLIIAACWSELAENHFYDNLLYAVGETRVGVDSGYWAPGSGGAGARATTE